MRKEMWLNIMLYHEFKHYKNSLLKNFGEVAKRELIKSRQKVLIDCIVTNYLHITAYQLFNPIKIKG